MFNINILFEIGLMNKEQLLWKNLIYNNLLSFIVRIIMFRKSSLRKSFRKLSLKKDDSSREVCMKNLMEAKFDTCDVIDRKTNELKCQPMMHGFQAKKQLSSAKLQKHEFYSVLNNNLCYQITQSGLAVFVQKVSSAFCFS